MKQLRTYQSMMIDWMIDHPRCALWATMGMGKTVSVLTYLKLMHDLQLQKRPTLIIAPKRVARDVWPYEAREWPHLRGFEVVPILGSEKERKAALKSGFDNGAQAFSINYDNIVWLIDLLAQKGKWVFGQTVADESTRLKGFRLRQGGIRAQKLSQVAHLKHMTNWINLTGTPAPNGLLDLWGQTWFLDAGARLKQSYSKFVETWFTQLPYSGRLVSVKGAEKEIYQLLSDICITVDAKDWFPIEQPLVTDIHIDMPQAARKIYRKMENDLYAQIGDSHVTAFNAGAMTMKCQQIASGFAYPEAGDNGRWEDVHNEKLDALEELIEEWGGESLLVAVQFEASRQRILKAFPKKAREILTKADEDAWNRGEIPLAVAHPKSMGHGLNLQHGGRVVVFFDQDWDLELYQQMIDRVGPTRQRQSGYRRMVHVYHLIAADTIDQTIVDRRVSKDTVQAALMAAMNRRRVAVAA